MMQQPIKRLRSLTMLALLGIMLGKIVDSKTIQAQNESPMPTDTSAVPTAIVLEPPTPVHLPQTRILFVGDLNLGRCIAERTIIANGQTNNYNYPFEFVSDELRAADITVGSLDGSLSDESTPMPCPESMNLIGPTRMVEGLQFAGFDVISVAANHIKDCGEKGYECNSKALLDTIHTLTEADIQPVGVGNTLAESRLPVVVERNGIRFAFLGINQIDQRVWASENIPGTAPLSDVYIEKIKAEIISAKQIADVVIVLPHWGVEHDIEPQEIQRAWAQEFIDAGASLVVGNHPHIVQPLETFSDKLIFYSLGNFVFDQGDDFQRESIVVEVNFSGAEIENWQLHPAKINYYTYQPYWAEDAEAEQILAKARRE
jgi:poly-gamma-glutamate capsule biosynthesis protein CapA/YwtB (metallophosphatase superfamily)